ncbi:MAG: ATP-binding protein [bacterium]
MKKRTPNSKPSLDPRKFMLKAIEIMNTTVNEKRGDKTSPKVGAILVSPDGELIGTAARGELRAGDHAEYTLIDKKFRDKDITGSYLFATLEPCAPGSRRHPKVDCSERIVNARVKKVWVGIEDPDPIVDRKGIKYLEESGIEVEMFDEDLQDRIRKENEQFLLEAQERAYEARKPKTIELTPLERQIPESDFSVLSSEALEKYLAMSQRNYSLHGLEFKQHLVEKGLLAYDEQRKVYAPTGIGILLFGKNPSDKFPQAVLKAEAQFDGHEPEIRDFKDALVLVPSQIEEWLRNVLRSSISREHFVREDKLEFPLEVIREAVINALVHRDYDVENAKCYLKITHDTIIVQSPGLPVRPIKLQDFIALNAPVLSRNPKITSLFSAMHLVEERGIGMATLKSLPEKYDLPLPIVTWNDPYITLTFPRSVSFIASIIGEQAYGNLNEEEREGLLYIYNQKEVSKLRYAQHFGYNNKKAQRHLSQFTRLGLVIKKGKSTALKYQLKK